VFNPQAVLIGGGLIGAGEFLFGPARETARARCYQANWEQLHFGPAGLGAESGLLGAAALAFERAGIETRVRGV
ncbi:MAG TPA: ROK family protein, partial [Bacteroidetes bacterium]|nr:ROK family protein [Bacteroidota bacterium]